MKQNELTPRGLGGSQYLRTWATLGVVQRTPNQKHLRDIETIYKSSPKSRGREREREKPHGYNIYSSIEHSNGGDQSCRGSLVVSTAPRTNELLLQADHFPNWLWLKLQSGEISSLE